MPKDFSLGLVFLSYLVAVTASHVTLLLAARVRDPHATNWKLWVASGGLAMGIGIWSMHFVATLALKLPISVAYDLSLTALSWVFAIVACSAAFMVLRRLTGKHREFLLPGALIGIGIASMHYTGDASMKLSPSIFIRNVKTSPPSWQPKQWKNCRAGVTWNDGDFSSWKGQRPFCEPPPALRSVT